MIGTAGDTGSAGQRLGACSARDVQTVGSRVSTVPSPTRLPLRHVVRVSHGEHSSQSILYGLLLRTNLNRVSRWCLQVHHQSCGFFVWVSWRHFVVAGLAVQSERRQFDVCHLRYTSRSHVRAVRDIRAVLAVRRREGLGRKLSQSEATSQPCAGAVVGGEEAGR